VRALLRRQAGVQKANYSREGVIEVEADARSPFEVRQLLSALEGELGFGPIQQVEVTLVGRIHADSRGWTIRPNNSEETFAIARNARFERLKATGEVHPGEVVLRGKLQRRKGAFVLVVEDFRPGASAR
jgi:hypothetical protein